MKIEDVREMAVKAYKQRQLETRIKEDWLDAFTVGFIAGMEQSSKALNEYLQQVKKEK